MSRVPSSTDFQITVDGIGTFTFARRRMRDEMAVASEFSRLTEGVETPTPFLRMFAGCMATLKVLTVEAPEGWVIDEMDPLDEDTYAKLVKVHTALREKEGSFRSGTKPEGEARRQGSSEDA